MKPFAPEHIASVIAYPPGKPVEEPEREYGITSPIKLASNKDSLCPSRRPAGAILAAQSKLNCYSDESRFHLRPKLAAKYFIPLLSWATVQIRAAF